MNGYENRIGTAPFEEGETLMKRERRHELHTNALAQWLADTIEAIKPHANTIVLVVCAAALVFAGVSWWRWYSASASQQTWDALARAINSPSAAGALDDLVEKYPGSEAARWAAVLAADSYLRDGCDQVLTSKEIANQQLQKAVDHYVTVLEDKRLDPALQERATFGLARAYEALSGTRRSEGELDKAAALYDQLLNEWPQGAYAKMAARRAAELKRTDVRKFYDQLAQYDPRKTSGPAPAGRRRSGACACRCRNGPSRQIARTAAEQGASRRSGQAESRLSGEEALAEAPDHRRSR